MLGCLSEALLGRVSLTQLPGSAVVILSYHPGLDADQHPDPQESFAKP